MSSSICNNNSISISVSDNEPDEQGRMWVRAKRKRKKLDRGRTQFTQRLIRWFVKYWILFVLLLTAALLIFEATRIGRKPNSARPRSNLNKLDPITRVVAGVRERCLKIRPAEELEHLEIPLNEQSSSDLVKKLVYISDKETQNDAWQRTNRTRFNLFTGNQTINEREKSFKISHVYRECNGAAACLFHHAYNWRDVHILHTPTEANETTVIHCGFFSENGGFIISDDYKSYMGTCKVVVSTCTFGGGDDLYQPIGISEASLAKVCFVAFWDEITLEAQESHGNKVGEDGFIGKWRVVIVKNLPFLDQRLNGKIPKMLPHRLFPHVKYSIWVDSKYQFRRDPLGVIEALLLRTNSVLAISEHGARTSVYDEAKAVVEKHKATPEEVEVQMAQYRKDGLLGNKRFNGKKALNEASIIVREHTTLTNMLMCLWFNEVVRFTSRDQLSFPYVVWRLKVVKNINMFPVCTRRDLANIMGHKRKAKPLTNRC